MTQYTSFAPICHWRNADGSHVLPSDHRHVIGFGCADVGGAAPFDIPWAPDKGHFLRLVRDFEGVITWYGLVAFPCDDSKDYSSAENAPRLQRGDFTHRYLLVPEHSAKGLGERRYLCGKFILPYDPHAGAASFANAPLRRGGANCVWREIVFPYMVNNTRFNIPVSLLVTKGRLLAKTELTAEYSDASATPTPDLLKGSLACLKDVLC